MEISYYEDMFNFFLEKLKQKPNDKQLQSRLLDIMNKVKKIGTRYNIFRVEVELNNKNYHIYYSNIQEKDIKSVININHKGAKIIDICPIKTGKLINHIIMG